MNRLLTRLPSILCALLATTPIYAKQQPQWLSESEFVAAIDTTQGSPSHYLAVSEKFGIALLNDNNQALSLLPLKSEQLSFKKQSPKDDKGVLATLDINSGNILLINVNLRENELSQITQYKIENTAIDAVCLGAANYGFDLFAITEQGEVNQHAVYFDKDGGWQIENYNHFTVGPNIKSCAVDETTGSLYIAEENIGIWRYSTNPELELERNLYQLPERLEVESVDTSEEGDVAVASPSINKLWLLDKQTQRFEAIQLAQGVAPKSVQISRHNQNLKAFIFDDNTEKNDSFTIENAKPAKLTQQQSSSISSLPAFAQTEPVDSYGDAADDPEVWVNSYHPQKSLIYGTDKKSGLDVYDLSGKRIATLKVGRINNVDIRYNIRFNGEYIDLAAASNRTNKSISLFKIDRRSGIPEFITDIKTDLNDPYGLCMSQDGQQVSVWINDSNGRFQGYELDINKHTILGKKRDEWLVASQPEGCVSDDQGKRLFYGEESTGVWLKTLDSSSQDILITEPHSDVKPDIEGMSLYHVNNQQYLIVSSQGNNRYAVYAVDNSYKYLGVFEVVNNWGKNIDGASETDGLAVTSHALGTKLPYGLLVVQDGRNVMPKAAQNFKLIDGTLLRDWILDRINE